MRIEKVKFKSVGYEFVGEINFPDSFTGKFLTVERRKELSSLLNFKIKLI